MGSSINPTILAQYPLNIPSCDKYKKAMTNMLVIKTITFPLENDVISSHFLCEFFLLLCFISVIQIMLYSFTMS